MKIHDEIRKQLREPLPEEAVSPHPTKTYLSTIKPIYVIERINDVFGLGSWTLKSEVIERIEKFVVVKAVLEIPDYGFYGEAYGGNDNADIGDAYKGATTDALTKIAGQQLEIGIDVFKGKATDRKPRQQTSRKPDSEALKSPRQATKHEKGSEVSRDLDAIKSLPEFHKAISDDFGIQPPISLKILDKETWPQVTDSFKDCYLTIMRSRADND